MKPFRFLFFTAILLMSLNACESDTDTDKPTIDLTIENAFPTPCDTLYFGEPFTFKALFKDNVELGSYSIDIHNNFDHHTHATELEDCDLAPIKTPILPIVFIEDYAIPEGLSEYETNLTITIPTGNGSDFYDEGDYHFFISLTDKEGWSAQKGMSIKLFHD